MSKEKTFGREAHEPDEPLDPNKGEHHGLTPEQVKKVEDARGDKEPSPEPETGMPAEDTPAMGTGAAPEEVEDGKRDR
jgi:hypothetical protein